MPSRPPSPSSHTDRPITVLVVDDSPDITVMIARMVEAEADMRVAGTLHDAKGLAGAIASLAPRIVLLDLTIPGVSVLDELRAAREACAAAGTRVLAFSGYDDPDTEAEAKRAGAVGLVSKGEEPEAIIRAIRQAAT